MTIKSIITIIAGTAFLFLSCGQPSANKMTDNQKIETYTNNEIGWTMEIPKGWTIIDDEQMSKTDQKGHNTVRETLGEEMDISGLKNLISFQKDQFNIFQSTIEPFEPEYEDEWEQNNATVKKLIYNTFLNQGIKVDSSQTTIEKIAGLEFQKFSFTIYGPGGDVILNQILYSKLINGFDFGVNIHYNNDKDRDELLEVFRNSKFK